MQLRFDFKIVLDFIGGLELNSLEADGETFVEKEVTRPTEHCERHCVF
jgi:hypothetical protein